MPNLPPSKELAGGAPWLLAAPGRGPVTPHPVDSEPATRPAPPGLWQAAAQAGEDAVLGLDRLARVCGWTEGARRLFGYEERDISGRSGQLLFSKGPGETFASWVSRARQGETLTRRPATAVRRDGMLVPVAVTVAPLAGADGVCVVVRDVTEQVAVQKLLAENHRRQTEALQLSRVGFWLWDARSDSVQMSDELYRIYGLDPLIFDGTMAARIRLADPSERRRLRRNLRAALGGRSFEMEYPVVRPDGTTVWVYERATVERLDDGTVAGLSGICQDVTERRESADELRRHAELLELLQKVVVAANEAHDLADAVDRCMAEMCGLLGWHLGHSILIAPDGSVSRHLWHIPEASTFKEFRTVLEQLSQIDGGPDQPATGPTWHAGDIADHWLPAGATRPRTRFDFPVHVNGATLAVVELYSTDLRYEDPRLIEAARHMSIQIGRVVERERASLALTHQALHDPLTGLPNRTLFLDRLGQSLTGLGWDQAHLAVMFIDLDNFKLINDSLGHEVGDRVLRAIADRLTQAVHSGETAARFGGDEFIIMCDRLSSDEAVGDLANHYLAAIEQPILLDGEVSTVVTASIGIAIASSPEARPDHLLRDADSAMYRAKEEGKGRFHVFDTALHERASRKLSLATELRWAVARKELRLEYQPQLRMSDRRVVGVESLVRWDNPARGTLGPADWIPIAEEMQLVVPIGEWILFEACRTGREWLDLAGGPASDFTIGVNVSAVQLARPELIDCVVAATSEAGLDPRNLCLEITESVLMSAPEVYMEALFGLKLVGVSLAVDDFGTGYSSLAYLRRFPIDVIKIDKAFVDDLTSGDLRGQAIMRAIVQLSDALGLKSVAEGVETANQVAELMEAGCFGAQGYFYARPGPPEGITTMLSEGRAAPRLPSR